MENSEAFEELADEYNEKIGKELEIIVFEIDVNTIDTSKLFEDENNLSNYDDEITTYFYDGVIPFDKLKIITL